MVQGTKMDIYGHPKKGFVTVCEISCNMGFVNKKTQSGPLCGTKKENNHLALGSSE